MISLGAFITKYSLDVMSNLGTGNINNNSQQQPQQQLQQQPQRHQSSAAEGTIERGRYSAI